MAREEIIRAVQPFSISRGGRTKTFRQGEKVEGLTPREFAQLVREGKISVAFHRPGRIGAEH